MIPDTSTTAARRLAAENADLMRRHGATLHADQSAFARYLLNASAINSMTEAAALKRAAFFKEGSNTHGD